MKTKLLILFSLILALNAHAGSATWSMNPGSGSWTTAANWLPNTIPDGPDDIATLDVSNSTTVSVNSVEVNSVVFNPGASAYTISSFSIGSFSITGADVINDSGSIQNFVATASFALIGLDNGASGGTKKDRVFIVFSETLAVVRQFRFSRQGFSVVCSGRSLKTFRSSR